MNNLKVKNCSCCARDVVLENFSNNGRGRKRSDCRECQRIKKRLQYRANCERYAEIRRAWKRANPGRDAMASRKRRYGLEENDFLLLLTQQENKCAICKKEFVGVDGRRGPHVDHSHVTEKVRGLLCGSCNRALGLLNDDISKLQEAIQYLQR